MTEKGVCKISQEQGDKDSSFHEGTHNTKTGCGEAGSNNGHEDKNRKGEHESKRAA